MQGTVVWGSRGVRRELTVSGASWRILVVLSAAAGALVTVPEIAEGIEQESHKAVRSALQRLVADLRKSGLGGLIVNVRRQGYLYDASFRPSA
jgi:DNA-binding response OmpR family regulator